MSSPKIVSFTIYDAMTGAPLAGATPTFSTYKNDLGTNLSQPVINEIGGGLYYFTPAFTVGRGIAFVVATGASPSYHSGYVRPEDFNVDNADVASSTLATATAVASVLTAIGTAQVDITLIKKLAKNKWEIKVSGPDVNRMIFYDDDGTTPILKVDLADSVGTPTSTNPFSRTPV